MKTLVIASHPYPNNSIAVKALQSAVSTLPNVIVRNLESLYGQDISRINVAEEQAAYEGVDRVVFMFPIHWFNLTSMLKAYLNEVWTQGWAFGKGGEALKGKQMKLVVTAGASEHTYSQTGLIQSTMDQVLTPFKASALFVGMQYETPLAFYDAMGVSDESLRQFQEQLQATLSA